MEGPIFYIFMGVLGLIAIWAGVFAWRFDKGENKDDRKTKRAEESKDEKNNKESHDSL